MPYVYEAYGLQISSALELTGLRDSGAPIRDVEIRPGSLRRPDLGEEPEGQGCWHASPGEASYHWSGIGSFLVRSGSEVIYDLEEGADEVAVRLAVIGPIMATVLHQKGYLVLHASAVFGEGAVVAFVGPSGRGKSTTASSMLAVGYELFTDDLLALRFSNGKTVMAVPGPSQVKLWPASAVALGHELAALPRIGSNYAKRVHQIPTGRRVSTAPLKRLYLIQEGPFPSTAASAPREALMELMTHSYCSEVLRFCDERDNFLQCAELVRRVPVRTLIRGESLDQISTMTKAIMQDLEQVAP